MLNNLLQVNRRLLELNGIDVNQTNRNLEFGYQVKNNIFGLTINGNNNSSSLSASTTSSSLLLSSSTHGNYSNINENSIHSDTIDVPATTTTTSISGSGSGGSSITPPASSRHVNSPTFTEQLGGSFKLMRSLSSIASHDPTISTTNATNNNIITASTAAAAANNNNNNNSNKNNDNVNADNVNDYNVTEANTAVNGGMNNGSISRNTIVIGITDKQNVVKSSETKSIISTTPTQAKDINSKETLRKTSMESSLTPTTTTTTTTPINALTTIVAELSPSSSSSSSSSKESIDCNNSLSTLIKKDNIEFPSNNETNKQTIVKKKEMENKTTDNDDSKPKTKQNVSFTTKPVFHNFNSIFQKASITILQTINYQIPSASLLWKSCWLHGENYR